MVTLLIHYKGLQEKPMLTFHIGKIVEYNNPKALMGKKKRGQTRGVKWADERTRTPGVKPSCQVTSDMKRIVGENAMKFVTEVGHWLRSILSIRCRRWNDMDNSYKERLMKKIRAEWNLPEGGDVGHIVENQCKVLYRQWRFRLKEQFYDGFSLGDALKNCPEAVNPDDWKWIVEKHWGSEKQKRISQANRVNRSKQKVKAVQGSKSTARILEQLRKNRLVESTSQSSEQVTQNTLDGTEAPLESLEGVNEMPLPSLSEPEYVKLWNLTKRHKDKSMDEFAGQKLEEFKKLHQEQLDLHGVDNLTVEEAYTRVLGSCSGYINGLGSGPKPIKRMQEGRAVEESMQFTQQMTQQFQQLEQNSRNREAYLEEKIQGLQQTKIAMIEEMDKMKRDAKDREDKIKQDAKEREERIKAEMKIEMQAMFQEQLLALASGQLNGKK